MKKKGFIIRAISLLVLAGCIFCIASYFHGVNEAEEEASELRHIIERRSDMTAEPDNGEDTLTYAENGMISKYYPLYEMNNDITGWLTVYGTNIDYPVMYKNDSNDYYLKRGFDTSKQSGGSLFLDYECSYNDSNNLVIYGHNMRSGTMFAQLLKYKEKSFFDNNGYIAFDSMYKAGTYRVIGAFYAKKNDNFQYHLFTKKLSEEEYNSYVKRVKELSLYDTGETAVYGTKLLTLSTCSYNSSNERFVVVAKQIEEK